MKMHYPTVPVEAARERANLHGSDWLRPLVLVVDDEPIITETLAAILNGSGLAALTARDGLAALDLISVVPPEMLITDFAMPGMNGIDLALEVSRTVPDCKIILFSGQASTADMAARVRAAGRDFLMLVKPVHPSDLLHKVFEAFGERVHSPAPTKPRTPSMYDSLLSGRQSNGTYSPA